MSNLLGAYLWGWEEIEPTILGAISMNQNLLLMGSHGIGKTSFMKHIARALSQESDEELDVGVYNMEKENMIGLCGVPDPEAMRNGKFEFCNHNRSIFKKDVVLLDEITRAPKENQNLCLEILQEKSVFGIKLDKLKYLVATANDESYMGTYDLDAALLDRFYGVITIPSIQNTGAGVAIGPEELTAMIKLNAPGRDFSQADENLLKAINKIRETYEELVSNEKILDNVLEFTSRFFSEILAMVRENEKYQSVVVANRNVAEQFPYFLLAIAAYYKAVKDDDNYLQAGGRDAIIYGVQSKFHIQWEHLKDKFNILQQILSDQDTLITKAKTAIHTGDLNSRIKALNKHADIIGNNFEVGERIVAVEDILNIATDSNEDIESILSITDETVTKLGTEVSSKIFLKTYSASIQKLSTDENGRSKYPKELLF